MSAVSLHLRRLRLRARGRVDAESILEAEFEREALSTERLRLLVLTIVIASGLSLSLIAPAFFPEEVARALHGDLRSFGYWRLGVLAALILYLMAERVLLSRRIKSGRKAPASYRYVSAFVETSCP